MQQHFKHLLPANANPLKGYIAIKFTASFRKMKNVVMNIKRDEKPRGILHRECHQFLGENFVNLSNQILVRWIWRLTLRKVPEGFIEFRTSLSNVAIAKGFAGLKSLRINKGSFMPSKLNQVRSKVPSLTSKTLSANASEGAFKMCLSFLSSKLSKPVSSKNIKKIKLVVYLWFMLASFYSSFPS